MITGQESELASALTSAITSALEAQYGGPIGVPNYVPALSAGIANALIPFLVANTQVNTGQSVAVPASGLEAPDGAVTGSATGTVDTTGTIS
jgi:hypothetical protein